MPLFHEAHQAQLLQQDPDKPYIVMRISATGQTQYWGSRHGFFSWVEDPENAKHYKGLYHAHNRAGVDGYVIDLREPFDLNAEQKERDAAAIERIKVIAGG